MGKSSPASKYSGDLKSLFPPAASKRTKLFAYGVAIAFVLFTAFLAFSPSPNANSPMFNSLFTSSSSFISHLLPYSDTSHVPVGSGKDSSMSNGLQGNGVFRTGSVPDGDGMQKDSSLSNGLPRNDEFGSGSVKDVGNHGILGNGLQGNGDFANGSVSDGRIGSPAKNSTLVVLDSAENGVIAKNQSKSGSGSEKKTDSKQIGDKKDDLQHEALEKNQTVSPVPAEKPKSDATPAPAEKPKSDATPAPTEKPKSNATPVLVEKPKSNATPAPAEKPKSNATSAPAEKPKEEVKKNNTALPVSGNGGKKRDVGIDQLLKCDIFHGNWVEDDSYPLYPEGSCPHIDEPFDCFRNGRKDRAYQKLRWQPSGCNIPRLNGTDMLEKLRGKRLVFVGDSLNRNMWESLVCVLRNSVKDKKKVFEASGKRQFKTEGSYSFIFKDYGCTVEFFRSPFLVQEWEMPDHNGSKKETLRLDVVEKSAYMYKDAYAVIFNTGHWWTHDKTAQGKDYYQEGNHVYSELNVAEAFHKALNTWSRWVDANVNPQKTHVFFRGYSASHFSGGQWNSGGQCDKETEPIKNEKYLSSYPPKMTILEDVLKKMKTHVSYMNITRMTDYRKDAHPSVYQKPNMTPEERAPDKIQDCSHWCLPGVPDSWNELLYAQLLIKLHGGKH